MKTKEVEANELRVGMVVVARRVGKRYVIKHTQSGLKGLGFPHLTMSDLETGDMVGHDTGLDSYRATYSIEIPE